MSEFECTLKALATAIVSGEDLPQQVRGAYPDYSAKTAQDIYRNNYFGNLHDALAGAYPVVRQLVGEAFFRFMVRRYIESHAPDSANLHHYGSGFADFTQGFEAVQSLPYLADVARLEWFYHVAYFAADEAPLSLDALAVIPSAQYPALCLQLHVSSAVVSSAYPLVDIWRAHQSGGDFCVDMNKSCHVLVARQGISVEITEVSAAQADWLSCLLEGLSLGEILTRYPDFELQSALIRFAGLLTGFSLRSV